MRSLCFAAAALVFLGACGGGGDDGPGPSPGPAPIPAAQTCDSLGGTASTVGVPILNGADWSAWADRSSVVLLRLSRLGQVVGSCSATMITRRAILTAAHCLDEGIDQVQVWLGSGDLLLAQSFVHYPNYVFNQQGFDVGVVFMAQDLPRTPIPVLSSRDARVGETAIIAGWGRDQNNQLATLRAGSTTISGVSTLLQTAYAPPSSSVCQGDSGGPILLQEGGVWSVAGITSATSANVCNTGTNFYQAVRHASVLDFIGQQVPDAAQR